MEILRHRNRGYIRGTPYVQGDCFMMWDICHTNTYQIPFDEPLRRVVDVGSNIGTLPYLLRGILGWDTEMICIEPDPTDHECLHLNARGCHVYQGAVSYSQETQYLWDHPESRMGKNTGSATLSAVCPYPGWVKVTPEPIETRTLEEIMDSFCWDTADLLKLDCEGSEFEILENAEIQRFAEIRGEWHGRDKFESVTERLERFGWRMDVISPGGEQGIFRFKRSEP